MRLRKTLVAATALAALAFAALPAIASASPTVDIEGSTHFTTSGGTALLLGSQKIHCESSTGTGEFASDEGSTGWIEFTFHGCTTTVLGFPVSCTSEGQPSRTITTTELEFHVMKHNGAPVILITSNEGHFASFNCSSVHVTVGGNGIIGALTAPGYNEPSNTFTVEFAEAEAGGQAITTTDETGETEWRLTAQVGSGEPKPAVEVAEGTGTFTEGGTATITKE
ncbi:MAG TPA: hypothetical protein VFG58_07525 [Solirubrobacterales bacterium]|nr:hypothetical protein [Solirubrobacterales bacterium]